MNLIHALSSSSQPFGPLASPSSSLSPAGVFVAFLILLIAVAVIWNLTVLNPKDAEKEAMAEAKFPDVLKDLRLTRDMAMADAGDDAEERAAVNSRFDGEVNYYSRGQFPPMTAARIAGTSLLALVLIAVPTVMAVLWAIPETAASDEAKKSYSVDRAEAIERWAADTYGVTAGASSLDGMFVREVSVIADGVASRVTLEYIEGIPVLMQDAAGGVELPKLDSAR